MFWVRVSLAIGVSLACLAPAQGEVPSGPSARWAVLASRSDLDSAIGVARTYQWTFDDVSVVRSSNGWFAVIAGPVPVPKGLKAAKQELLSRGYLPSDLFLSNGEEFVEVEWTRQRPTFDEWEAKSSRSAKFDHAGYRVTVDTVSAGADGFSPRIVLAKPPEPPLTSVLGDVTTSEGGSTVTRVPLDPAAKDSALVFSAYWGGAHCCTVTKIFTVSETGLHEVPGDTLDGGGYAFDDLDGDSSFELLSSDNRFLYAFAPYAMSRTPTVVQQVRGSKLVDRRHDAAFARYYRQELAGMEHEAEREPSLWKSNGYLAAWVATKALVGEFDEAWTKAMASYDRQGDWPLKGCSARMKLSDCPENLQVDVTYPVALRALLEDSGYIPGSDAPSTEAPVAGTPSVASTAPAPSRPPAEPEGEGGSSGTGFFVSASGEVLTNQHVIESCTAPTVQHQRSLPVPATVIAADKTNDLALLKADIPVGRFARFNMKVRLGEPVAAFGYPLSSILSSGGNFTLGNVTALTGLRDDTRYLQISAPVQPGNSGGPLVDHAGNVTGVVTAKFNAFAAMLATGDIVQNVNFAIRGSTAASFLSAHGVEIEYAEPDPAAKMETPDLAEMVQEFAVAIRCGG